MIISMDKESVTLTPENAAEVYYLEHTKERLDFFKAKYSEDRQWVIQSLTLPLIKKEKAHE